MNLRFFLVAGAVLTLGVAAGVAFFVDRDTYRGPNTPPAMPKPEVLHAFASKKIFFGHQSVGYNILDGLAALKQEFAAAGATFPEIREIASADQITGPGVYHARAGRNLDPYSKIASFESALIEQGIGAKVDVVLLKFCYVDLVDGVEPAQLADAYLASMARIKKALPHLDIIYITLPLTSHTWSIKSQIRVLLKGDKANIRRSTYNELLLEKLGRANRLVDIALIESTRPDGSREQFSEGGRTYPAMYRGYTYDNGHLNKDGAVRVAVALIDAVVR